MKTFKIAPFTNEAYATVPTGWTRRMRRCIPLQLWRFVVINFKILRMIMRSHH
jgi:hypothetical protein